MGRILRLSEVPETPSSAGRWQALNTPLGISTFGVNAVSMEPGEQAEIEHDESESKHQEVYVVVAGRAAFRLGAEQVEAGPGGVAHGAGDIRSRRGHAGGQDRILERTR